MTPSQTVGKRDSSRLLYIVPDFYVSEGPFELVTEAVSHEFELPSKLVTDFEESLFPGQRVFTLKGNELWTEETKLGILSPVPDYIGKLLKHDYVRTSQGWWVLCRT